MRKIVACLLLAASLALLSTSVASPVQYNANLLKLGSSGQKVKDLQWLLSGHKQSKYSSINPYTGKIDGQFGTATADAVKVAKYRLGYPKFTPSVGKDFIEILEGKRARPPLWVVTANQRLAKHQVIDAQTASTLCAHRIISVAQTQIGVHESPWHSNSGPQVHEYQRVTGAFNLPWCASFVQWVYKNARVDFPQSFPDSIAEHSAGVFHIVGWAQNRGWLRAIPAPAYLVAFMDHAGHIGIVESVSKTGVYTIEGNTTDAVRERYRAFGSRPMVFIAIPGCS